MAKRMTKKNKGHKKRNRHNKSKSNNNNKTRSKVSVAPRKTSKPTKDNSMMDDYNIEAKQVYSYNLDENEITDKELEIIDENVDKLTEISKRQEVNSSVVKNIITIVEDFLRGNKLICYGGTAINNILPMEQQFYDYTKEIPDYDFFSKNALEDAKRLADIYLENGFAEVEAKSGMHTGTYKVYVNFIPIADITQLDKSIFDNLYENAIEVFGISYAPPDYLRMSMYLELSRPRGDVSRWEKVAKRLSLLNRAFPMRVKEDCMEIDFSKTLNCKDNKCKMSDDQKSIMLKHLIGLGVVFFGGYASSLYSKHMNKQKQKKLKNIPYYDVISQNAKRDVLLLKAKLKYDGFKEVKITEHISKIENIPDHYELTLDEKIVAIVYQSLACHNYNVIRIDGNNIHIATIDTMLNMYLVFLFTDDKHLNNIRIMCMAKFIFDLHQKNRLNQNGIFRRFNLPCIGKQDTILDIRRHKTEKYEELKNKKNVKEFEMNFLRYIPSEMNNKPKKSLKKRSKTSKSNSNSKSKSKPNTKTVKKR